MKTKTTTDIRERIAVRAYLMWEKHYQAGIVNAVLPGNDLGYWLAAERIELDLVERRAAATKKAAETRKLNAVAKAPVAAVVAASKRRPSASRPTAH